MPHAIGWTTLPVKLEEVILAKLFLPKLESML
jgi:hypothetical protein